MKSYTLHFQSMRITSLQSGVWRIVFDLIFCSLLPSKKIKPVLKTVEKFVNSEVSKNNLKNLTFHVNCQFSLTFLKITHQFWHVFQQKIATCCLSSHFSKTASLSFGFFGGSGGRQLSSEPLLLTLLLGADFLSLRIPFLRAVAALVTQLLLSVWLATMEILSALKSWSSSKEKLSVCKFESPNLRSPRFRRWGSKKQRRNSSQRNLPTCRENRASTSNSVPNSIFGDSCSDLSSVRVNTFRSEDYLDPFQGKTQRVSLLNF